MLSIGSLYGHGFDPDQLAELERCGFTLRPEASLFPGSQLCRFIDFPTGPSLELIEVTDPCDYEAFVPAGMTPLCPGISLQVADGSPAALEAYERDFADHEPYRLRVPYRGDAAPGAPGWHYLNFARPVVRGTFIWLTAFDQPRPTPVRTIRHANDVLGVVGLLFDLPPDELGDLAALTGQPVSDGTLRLDDVTIAATRADGQARGRFPLHAVVLRADNLETVRRLARSAVELQLLGRPAVRIRTNPLAWDLVITA